MAVDEAGLVQDLIEAMRLAELRQAEAERPPRVLLFDLENSPILGYTWNMYDTHVLDIVQDTRLLAVSYKWLGEGTPDVKMATDLGPGYPDDFGLTAFVHSLLDEADVVVAHNAKRFDIRKSNGAFVRHGFTPPSPYKTVDTLLISRRNFKLSSHRLDDLGDELGLGRKVQHRGFALWRDVMANREGAVEEMREYARQDVVLLERVFIALRPWMTTEVNYGLYLDTDEMVCTKCGSSDVHQRGSHKTRTNTYLTWVCANCGHYSQERTYDRRAPKPQLK